jgi:hypothetical protein
MEIIYWVVTYNGYSAHPLAQYAKTFLIQGAPRSLGSTIKTFELYAHVKTRGRAPHSLGGMKKDFPAHLKMLPRVRFLRRYARVDISYVCHLGFEEDLLLKGGDAGPVEMFRAACLEIASALQLAKTGLKKTDDFDWEAFSAHVNHQLTKIPTTGPELARVMEAVDAGHAKRMEQPPVVVAPSARALKKKPKLIAIDHDDHHASHIGRLADGAQFFLTTPFVPANDEGGREFVALYLFDAKGTFKEARIEDLGTRATLDPEHARKVFERLFTELGPVKFGRIKVEPFQVQRFGLQFGLIPELLENEEDDWSVVIQPGNYMAFFKPWNSGDYDT